jgi:hypothetical protein
MRVRLDRASAAGAALGGQLQQHAAVGMGPAAERRVGLVRHERLHPPLKGGHGLPNLGADLDQRLPQDQPFREQLRRLVARRLAAALGATRDVTDEIRDAARIRRHVALGAQPAVLLPKQRELRL